MLPLVIWGALFILTEHLFFNPSVHIYGRFPMTTEYEPQSFPCPALVYKLTFVQMDAPTTSAPLYPTGLETAKESQADPP